jgi:uncharacterized protein
LKAFSLAQAMRPVPDTLQQTPWWLPGGHAQTIWPALYGTRASGPALRFQRERWTTPDGDFIDLDWMSKSPRPPQPPQADTVTADAAPLLVLFHGLEGSSASHYAQSFARMAGERGWDFVVPHFRGCSGELNLAPRAYHSGDHVEIDGILRHLHAGRTQPMLAVGVSLGGNALMRWAAERGDEAGRVLRAAVAVSAPLDLGAAGAAIDQGLNRLLYARMFLRTMRAKAEAKWRQFPGLFDLEAVRRARTLHAFDDAFTAPLHGFEGVHDYWARAAAKPLLPQVRIPALVVNARNDPFIPAQSLPDMRAVGPAMTLWQPAVGGHVGWACPDGAMDKRPHLRGLPESVANWLQHHL